MTLTLLNRGSKGDRETQRSLLGESEDRDSLKLRPFSSDGYLCLCFTYTNLSTDVDKNFVRHLKT